MDSALQDQARRPDADDADLVRALLEPGAVTAVFQPIVRIRDDEVVGYEALARTTAPHGQGPALWLAAAQRHGRRADLEVACLEAAVASGPPPGGAPLFVNLSASLLDDDRVRAVLAPLADRLVIELSEQEQVDDYVALAARIGAWQEQSSLNRSMQHRPVGGSVGARRKPRPGSASRAPCGVGC